MSSQLQASLQVLIVEDDLMVASMVQEIVSKLGYEVVGPASDQPSANNLIDTTRIDAALISANLMSSAEDSAVHHLISRCIPFALITGYSDALDYSCPADAGEVRSALFQGAEERLPRCGGDCRGSAAADDEVRGDEDRGLARPAAKTRHRCLDDMSVEHGLTHEAPVSK
jgi:CheY-like chemotaxis protein